MNQHLKTVKGSEVCTWDKRENAFKLTVYNIAYSLYLFGSFQITSIHLDVIIRSHGI